MKMIPVSSSHLRAIGYDPPTREMRIEFLSGVVVAHYGVEPETHSALMSAESHGKAYNKLIRGKYGRPKEHRVKTGTYPPGGMNDLGLEESFRQTPREAIEAEPAPEHHDRSAMFEAALRRFRGEQ